MLKYQFSQCFKLILNRPVLFFSLKFNFTDSISELKGY